MMRGCLTIAVLCLAFGAAPVAAEVPPTLAEREAFIAAITANGCRMTEAEAPVKLPAVGIDKDTSGAITNALVAEGLAEVDYDNDVLTLKTEGCVP
jgi:hypothetical protein